MKIKSTTLIPIPIFVIVVFAVSALGQDPSRVKFRFQLSDPTDHVLVTLFSPDNSKILLACQKSTQIWSVETGKQLLTFPQKIDLNRGYYRLTWQPGGTKLLQSPAIGKEKQAFLWDTTDGRLLAAMNEKGGVTSASWNRDGTRILVTGEPVDTHRLNIRRSDYSIRDADGRLIRSGSIDGEYALSTRFAEDGQHLIINVDESPCE